MKTAELHGVKIRYEDLYGGTVTFNGVERKNRESVRLVLTNEKRNLSEYPEGIHIISTENSGMIEIIGPTLTIQQHIEVLELALTLFPDE